MQQQKIGPSIYDSFSFNGKPFDLVYGNTIGFLNGASYCLWDAEYNSRDFIWSLKNGFQAHSANAK